MGLRDGLVHHLPLTPQTVDNGVARAASGLSRHGPLRGNTRALTGAGPREGFVRFDGDGDYIPTGYFNEGIAIGAFSVAVFARTENTSAQIIAATDRSEYWRVGFNSVADGATFSLDQFDFGTGSAVDFADGTFRHYAFVFDPDATPQARIYVDGTLIEGQNPNQSVGSGNRSYLFLGTGSEASHFDGRQGPTIFFDGDLTDFRIYNRALSDGEIQTLASAQRRITHTPSLQAGLVGHWPMTDEASESDGTIRDATPNGFDAVPVGDPVPNEPSIRGGAVDLTNGDLAIRGKFYEGNNTLPAVSVAAWVNGTSNAPILSYDRSEFFRAAPVNWATASTSGTGIDDLSIDTNVIDGEWHHVVWVYDANGPLPKKRVYVDGALDVSRDDPHNGGALGRGPTRFGFVNEGSGAAQFNGGTNAFGGIGGRVSDLRLYERALTETEIARLADQRTAATTQIG